MQVLAETGIDGVVMMNKLSQGASRLSAFVRFSSPEFAQQVLQVVTDNPLQIRGHQLEFQWAKADTHGTA